MSWGRRLLLIAVVAFAAAMAGTYAGRTVFAPDRQTETELHALLHKDLNPMPRSTRRSRRSAFRHTAKGTRTRNARMLISPLRCRPAWLGPEVTAAIDHTHMVMAEMQKETLEHLFAMRAVLRPDQAAKFDRTVTRALSPEIAAPDAK
jgi:hypothetical protein